VNQLRRSSLWLGRTGPTDRVHQTHLLIEELLPMAKKDDSSRVSIRPLDDRVVVEALEAEEQTAGGILLPDTAKQKPQRGKVLAVGPGKMRDDGKRSAVAVVIGDEVLFGRYAGNDVEVNGKELKIMRENDILAKVSK
jgi:chaperonin GroES